MITKSIDETWTDGDCRSCVCLAPDPIMMDLLVSLGLEPRGPEPSCTVQSCDDGSQATEKYVMEEVPVPGSCCPLQRSVACKDTQGQRKEVGEQWRLSQCKVSRCVRAASGQAEVEVDTETCMTDCPPGSQYTEIEGQCCGKCSPLPEVPGDCKAVRGEGGEVGKIKVQIPGHGLCSNPVEIPDWSECLGHCKTGSYYSSASGQQEVNCTCCQPGTQSVISVDLSCPDGHSSVWSVAVPFSCSCTGCKHEQTSAALTMLEPDRVSVRAENSEHTASITGDITEDDIFGEYL